MDKRTVLAIVLSFLILVSYQELISYLYPPAERKPAPTQSLHPDIRETPPASSSRAADQPVAKRPFAQPEATARAQTEVEKPPEQEASVETEAYRAVVTSYGGRLKSLRLKRYPGDAGRESPPREMVIHDASGELPLGISLEGNGAALEDSDTAYTISGGNLELHGEDKGTLRLSGKTRTGTTITKIFAFSGQGYGIGLEVEINGAPQNTSALSLLWSHAYPAHDNNSSYYQVDGPAALVGRKFITETAAQVATEPKQLGPGEVRWAGYADTYFLAAMIPPPGNEHKLLFHSENGTIETKLTVPWNQNPVAYTLYVGPKEFTALNAVDPALDRAIDFGWFHFVARPLVYMLRFSHSLTGNFGIDIILLTILVKLAFFPLANKSFKSMAEMRKLQPQLEQLREQHKDDREKLNKEMMELYRRYKINPLSGCLPMLVQLPVFIGLYQGLMHAIELRQAPFFGWIQDLSQPDRLGSLAVPFVEPPGIPVLTLFMGGTMFLQQAMTPMGGDPMQQKLMMFMPLIFTVMFVNFPAGLVLYWLVNNVLSIGQQYLYNQQFGSGR